MTEEATSIVKLARQMFVRQSAELNRTFQYDGLVSTPKEENGRKSTFAEACVVHYDWLCGSLGVWQVS